MSGTADDAPRDEDAALAEEQAQSEKSLADAELEQPSTEEDPGEEPQAPAPHDPEPDHEAVGIGIPGQPQVGENDPADDD
jgi:hypothetical protein